LVLLVLAAPIQLKKFRRFFKCLQRQYIGANWFAAPIYWRITRRTKLFAAPRLFCQSMPIQSAGVSGSGNRFIRWRPNENKNERRSPQWELNSKHLTSSRPPLSSHYPLPLNQNPVKMYWCSRNWCHKELGTSGTSYLLRFSLEIRNTVNVCENVRHMQENRRDVGLQRI
jgi:hypothetical protein